MQHPRTLDCVAAARIALHRGIVNEDAPKMMNTSALARAVDQSGGGARVRGSR
jgi:hypothetical protein